MFNWCVEVSFSKLRVKQGETCFKLVSLCYHINRPHCRAAAHPGLKAQFSLCAKTENKSRLLQVKDRK